MKLLPALVIILTAWSVHLCSTATTRHRVTGDVSVEESLRMAVRDGNLEAAENAINHLHQTDINTIRAYVQGYGPFTLLLLAAGNGHTEVAELLLNNSAEVDAKDK